MGGDYYGGDVEDGVFVVDFVVEGVGDGCGVWGGGGSWGEGVGGGEGNCCGDEKE